MLALLGTGRSTRSPQIAQNDAYRQPIEQRCDELRMGALRDHVSPRILRRGKRDAAKGLSVEERVIRLQRKKR